MLQELTDEEILRNRSILAEEFLEGGIQISPCDRIPSYDIVSQSLSENNISIYDGYFDYYAKEKILDKQPCFVIYNAVVINFEDDPSWLVCLEDTVVQYDNKEVMELRKGKYRIIRKKEYRPIIAVKNISKKT